VSGLVPVADARLRIGALTVHAASAIEARRLAEALPAALERALAGQQRAPLARLRPADAAAAQIVAAIEQAQGRAA
jgi:hypothetical protein